MGGREEAIALACQLYTSYNKNDITDSENLKKKT